VVKGQAESSGLYTVNYLEMCSFVVVKDVSNCGVSKEVATV
jgi:hypothetical protein